MSDTIRVHPWAALFIRPAAVAMAVGVGVASFILSFTALTDVATRGHVPTAQAWLWPCTVDGATLLATLGAVVCMADRRARRFFWAVLIGGLLVSIGGNDLHAILPQGQELPTGLRAVVGAVAPIAVVVSIHGLTILIRVRVRRADPAPAVVQADRARPSATALEPELRSLQPDSAQQPATAAPDARDTGAAPSALEYEELSAKVMPLLTMKDIDATQVTSVLQMSYGQNLPNRDIGRRLDMRHHTVGKILDASAEVLRDEPLAAVS